MARNGCYLVHATSCICQSPSYYLAQDVGQTGNPAASHCRRNQFPKQPDAFTLPYCVVSNVRLSIQYLCQFRLNGNPKLDARFLLAHVQHRPECAGTQSAPGPNAAGPCRQLASVVTCHPEMMELSLPHHASSSCRAQYECRYRTDRLEGRKPRNLKQPTTQSGTEALVRRWEIRNT